MPSVIIQGKPLKLAAPRGFVNIQAVAPALFEEYRRAQHVLALYIDSCHMGGTCQSPAELLDPFVEVLMPETGSFVRDMSREFFESCKFEVEQSILGSGWASLVPSESGSPRSAGAFFRRPRLVFLLHALYHALRFAERQKIRMPLSRQSWVISCFWYGNIRHRQPAPDGGSRESAGVF